MQFHKKRERNHNNFRANLQMAQQGEATVAKLLEPIPSIEVININAAGKSHDIEILHNGKRKLIECKEDVRVADTGNIVIEYESWGKPSGISTTKADFWIFLLYNKDGTISYFGFEIDTLRKLIKEKAYWDDRQMLHTDSRNKLYFFKRDILTKHAVFYL